MRRRQLQHRRKTPLRVQGLLALAAAGLVFGGCAAPIEGGETQPSVGRAIQPIVGGIASGADQDSVVVLARFENGARVGLCTATLIAANLVITARHCISATDASAACGPDGAAVVGAMLHGDRAPATLAVFATKSGFAPDTTTDVGARAHGKSLVVDSAATICNHDLAFVVLDKAVAAPISPVRLGPPVLADQLTAVGFGITEAGALPSRRMQRSGLALVGVGPMAFPNDARYGAGDGELLLGESACAGDSGSPAFAKSGAIVGVASRAGNGKAGDPQSPAATCLGENAHAVYAELGAAKALATRAFAEAGATPWLEGQPDPRLAHAPSGGSSGSKTGSSGASSGGGATGGASGGAGDPNAVVSALLLPESSSGAVGGGDGDGGGCSASGAPVRGAVEDALGFVAVVLLLLRLRSAARRRADELTGAALDRAKDERAPYVDMGMRETFASLSDER